MKCQERAGFLIPRPCRNEATAQCSRCGKSVCGQHTASLIHGGLGCASCAGAENPTAGPQGYGLRNYYGYHPGVFAGVAGLAGLGLAAGYTDQDYAAFEGEQGRRRREGQPEEDEEDLLGS